MFNSHLHFIPHMTHIKLCRKITLSVEKASYSQATRDGWRACEREVLFVTTCVIHCLVNMPLAGNGSNCVADPLECSHSRDTHPHPPCQSSHSAPHQNVSYLRGRLKEQSAPTDARIPCFRVGSHCLEAGGHTPVAQLIEALLTDA